MKPAGGEMNRQGEKQAVMEPDEYRYKECKNMENKEKMPEWDLSEYYNGVDDPKIGEDIERYAAGAAAFAAEIPRQGGGA